MLSYTRALPRSPLPIASALVAILAAVAIASPTPPAVSAAPGHAAHVAGGPASRSSFLPSTVADADSVLVAIKEFKYDAPTLIVPAGTTVTWTNEDSETHTVTASDRAFSSTGLDRDEKYSHTFTTPGTYAYFCALHPFMTGQVVVQP
jgi:plastocyanin